jgi:stage II sporulation protein D
MSASREDPRRHYDVDATVRDQVYDGSIKEDLKAQRLVERTRGWVLTVGDAARPTPLKAFYHSTCGGVTELPERVWGNSFAGFKHAVRCPFCGRSPAFNWKLDLTAADVVEAFRRAVQGSDEPSPDWARSWPRSWRQAVAARRLLDLRVRSRDPQGRVDEVITSWAYTDPATGRPALAELSLTGARLREWVGPSRLRSAAFEVLARTRGAWRISGRGNGHGVGMCQWGAKTMGERGYKTASILKYYYPDAVLRKLW